MFPSLPLDRRGKHVKMFPRWYGSNGETFTFWVRNVSPSLLSTQSRMFPRRPCRHPPEVNVSPSLSLGVIPTTGKHSQKCFPVAAITPTGKHFLLAATGKHSWEMFPRWRRYQRGNIFSKIQEMFPRWTDGARLQNVSPLARSQKMFPRRPDRPTGKHFLSGYRGNIFQIKPTGKHF